MIERDRFSFRSKENAFEVTSRNANESKAKGSKTIDEFVDETLCRRQDNIGWQMVSRYLDYEKPILPVHLSPTTILRDSCLVPTAKECR